ncbi:MAG: cysteine desulfurase family protein [Bdellovibrionia bacterium]
MDRPIYLDHNATTPLDPAVFEEMKPFFLEEFGNASSRHEFGWAASQAVETARARVAAMIGCLPKEIIFTSGATEANNIALRGALTKEKNHIITCNIEHKAVLEVAQDLVRRNGAELTILPVDSNGLLKAEQVRDAITDKTGLISLIFGNNEIGTIHPIAEIGKIAKERGIYFHTDATQATGHVSVDVNAMGIDLLSLSAHKFHGPKGVGALYVRATNPRVKIRPFAVGGSQELGIRPGTLNVPGIVGLGKASEIATTDLTGERSRVAALRDLLKSEITSKLDGVRVNGDKESRLPHNLSLTFEGISNQSLLGALVRKVALSAGSACTDPMAKPSHVLSAIGLSDTEAKSTLRFGLGRFTTKAEIAGAAESVLEAVRKNRQ